MTSQPLTPEQLADLRRKAEAATPGPWNACGEGKCSCGAVWSTPCDRPVATVEKAKWGDEFWEIVHDLPASGFGDVQLSARQRMYEYGDGPDNTQQVNTEFIATANPAAILSLLDSLASKDAEIAELREELDSLKAWARGPGFERLHSYLHAHKNHLVEPSIGGSAIEWAAAELAALRERLAKVEEAVIPFGQFAKYVAGCHRGWDHDDFSFDLPGDYNFSMRWFRALRAALSEPSKTEVTG